MNAFVFYFIRIRQIKNPKERQPINSSKKMEKK